MKTLKYSVYSNIENEIIPGVNWCDICDVRVQLYNHVIAKEHETGKKHQNNLKNIKFITLVDE